MNSDFSNASDWAGLWFVWDSTQLSTKIVLINVKMSPIIGILTFICMINTTSESLKARNVFICRYFSFYE